MYVARAIRRIGPRDLDPRTDVTSDFEHGAPRRLSGDLAQIPTWKELGVNASFELWRGLIGPKGMTRAQVQFWDDALGRMVRTEEWKNDLARYDMENVYRNSADTARYWKTMHDQVKVVLTDMGLVK